MAKLTHFDDKGDARMVDVGDKEITDRIATAKGRIVMSPETLEMVVSGTSKKGDVLGVARLAGIMAAKQTSTLIPLCHPLALSKVEVELEPDESARSIEISATVRVTGRTGVEMEALTAVSVAALTVYDMCKAIDRGMQIGNIHLTHKSGGKSGSYDAD
jgi:cyclic pyranopterin phosphate synthase